VVGLVAVKAVAIAVLTRLFRFRTAQAVHLGLLLSQGGEFAFVVLGRAAQAELIPVAAVDVLTAIVAVSMAITPALAAAGAQAVHRHNLKAGEALAPGTAADDLTGHVIIAGFGRVGRTVAAILTQEEQAWIAIDRDPLQVTSMRARGHPVFFGDIRKPDVLRAVGAERARAVVITIDGGSSRERIVPLIRRLFPTLTVLVRARDRHQQKGLEAAGAHAVVPENLEGSLQLAGQVLRRLGTPTDEVHALLDDYRREDYARLEAATKGD
jgi:monovalent cation:H+ antiporter-2, CPA2 family